MKPAIYGGVCGVLAVAIGMLALWLSGTDSEVLGALVGGVSGNAGFIGGMTWGYRREMNAFHTTDGPDA